MNCYIDMFQIEFYFSDANLQKDRFLKKQIEESADGCKCGELGRTPVFYKSHQFDLSLIKVLNLIKILNKDFFLKTLLS